MKIRIVKTASMANAVQVVRYQNNKRVVLRHLGSAHSEAELNNLLLMAEEWIKHYGNQLSIFADENPNKLLHLNQITNKIVTVKAKPNPKMTALTEKLFAPH